MVLATAQIEEIAVLPGKVKIAAVLVGDDLYALHNSIDDNDHQFDELTILNLGKKANLDLKFPPAKKTFSQFTF
jgi:hypothetical protein